jgi:glycosyltransferase involved in cell wall biosynthesis
MRSPHFVLVVSRSCPPDLGGYQTQFNLVLPLLAELADVRAMSATRFPPGGEHIGWKSIHTHAFPAHRLPRRLRGVADVGVVSAAICLGLAKRGNRPALLLLSPTMVGAGVLARVWTRAIGSVVVRFPETKDIPRFLSGRGRRSADSARCKLIALSPEQQLVIRNAGYDATLITNAVDAPPLTTGATPTERRFLAIGRMIARRRLNLVVDAWAQIAHDLPHWSLHLVGSGGSEPDEVESAIANQIERDGVPRVTLHGAVRGASRYLVPGVILVHAAEREGVPNVVLEAMAAGIPVVASEGAMSRWFADPPAFVPWDGESAESLAAVLRAASGEAHLDQVAVAAQRQVRRSHDPRRAAEAYRHALDTRGAARETVVRVGWSRRRVRIRSDATVLDIGSGAFPNPRADILCELSPERESRTAVIDRPFVVADAQALPFRDGALDYLVASHLAEHVEAPEELCREFSRVAAAGYVETPRPWFEAVLPVPNHRWVVRSSRGCLNFRAVRPISPMRGRVTDVLHRVYYLGSSTASRPASVGRVGRLAGVATFVVRGVLNRAGLTTTGYVFSPARPLCSNVDRG